MNLFIRDGDRFWIKNSNLCCDTADFTSPPPYLDQDRMQSHVIDMCPFKVLHWLPKKNPQNPHPWFTHRSLKLLRHHHPSSSPFSLLRTILQTSPLWSLSLLSFYCPFSWPATKELVEVRSIKISLLVLSLIWSTNYETVLHISLIATIGHWFLNSILTLRLFYPN